ncbi:cryptochrome/photolyase family protein [Mobilicoccus pelagius]|uniref:Deoxyribodipyrimidine photo-lyase n=1 Tax=Mobilicoccus pelagius NBRC 104925 TaxID=1089455 RepID=H5USR5_9MICO|nr:deoxyribodipyrimidine photo-lyase [Mobilicoccus pelagius]GAB48773.1 deoxyribodipyrimidine photo-lyase [Mobilicoccus pelagius NBRC 104925]
MTSILWFRRDLRLHDHPALLAAHADGDVVPLVVLDPALVEDRIPRVAAFLGCVAALADSIAERGGRLVVRYGRPEEVVPAVATEAGARRVHVTAESEPYGRRRDDAVRAALAALPEPVDLVATGTPYAIGPGVITKGDGEPYKVFTPFSKAWRDHGAPGPAPLPDVSWHDLDSEELPSPPEVVATLPPLGEDAAWQRWADFCDEGLERYALDRDRPDLDATSHMSVHLKFGAIHPRTLLADIAAHPAGGSEGAQTYLTELVWREFYADVLWHRPDSEWRDLRQALADMEYDDPAEDPDAAALFDAWREGRTGYPIVDAGMRQLAAIGWMHNRVRMITASFLTKDLHVWWPHGAHHFLDHLVDGDPASNNHGWQWAAGTGTDAAPYFRVFNPLTQGAKFDPRGDYVRRWVPELADVGGGEVHDLAAVSRVAGYPAPIVDHAEERREALRRYESVR